MKILLYIEKFGPIFIGLLTFLVSFLFKEEIICAFIINGWSVSGLYSAVFGWASIQTGFIFGVFGFVAGSADGFVKDAKDTRPMKLFISYTKRAMAAAFFLSIVSMPLIVFDIKVSDIGSISYLIVSAWFSIFIWAFCAFARVAYIFGIIVRVPAKSS